MKNLSIRAKLILSIGVLALGYLLFLGLSEWTGKDLRHHLGVATDSLFPAALASQEAEVGFQNLIKDYKDAVLTQDVKPLALADEQAQKITTLLQTVREKTADNAELQQQVAVIQDLFKDINSQSKTTYTKMVSSPESMDEQSMATVKKLTDQNAVLSSSLKELNETISKKDFQAELTAVEQATSLQRELSILLFAIAVAFAIFTTAVLQKQIAVPLREAVIVLERVAEGDLTVSLEVHTRDEVGRMAMALNKAVEKLNSTMQEVSESAGRANASSQQLAVASEAIASGAQEQAASLEETSASLEEITATVRQSADNAHQASQLASGSKDSALQGQEVVSKAITAMSEINQASAKISDIISTIDEIAFQTNLLAVNAAVEAARAGEEGRGFAVVASEVRSLAQRSALAAKEIKVLIQDSLRKVEAGSALVNRSGETLQGIVGSVKRVTDIVTEIAAASNEQSTGIEQVNSAMTQMDRVTQGNSAQTESLSATAEALSEQAAHLLELVSTFTLTNSAQSYKEQKAYQPRETVPAEPVRVLTTVQPVKAASRPMVKTLRKGLAGKSKSNLRENRRSKNMEAALAVAGSNGTVDDSSFQEF